jgi:hypothetical protein
LGESFVNSALSDWRSSEARSEVRAVLGFLERMTVDYDSLGVEDVALARTAGVSAPALADAIYVCFIFNVIDRLADATGFALPPKESHDRAARVLLKRGYAMPALLATEGGTIFSRPLRRRLEQ